MQTDTPQPDAGSRTGKRDVAGPRLLAPVIMAASVVVMLVLSLASTGILMFHFSRHRPLNHMQPLGLILAPDQKPLTRFPGPNLQLDDGHGDSSALAAQQQARLNSYGWVDRSHGIVHIPVEQAMTFVLAQGLPTRSSTNDSGPLKLGRASP